MKKKYVILMGLFFFILTSCDEYKESHDAAKSGLEFILTRAEFRATQIKWQTYRDELDRAENVMKESNPYGCDQQSIEVLVKDASEKKLVELTQTAKKQFLLLCKVAAYDDQFKWLFKNKTDEMNESIAPDKSVATVLLDNKYFEPDSAWISFMLKSGAVKKMYGKK